MLTQIVIFRNFSAAYFNYLRFISESFISWLQEALAVREYLILNYLTVWLF